ncbi:hypothetical protein AB0L00_27300 [Actinoallomurus sp. NPDC052308]|uniref:hypothetical protein n=1 Tax=Actinoallomurus sp. NPDC052308 TaxID=3155530 RepID=UPI0034433D56
MAIEWTTLVATGSGAVIALAGTLLNDHLRDRRETRRGRQTRSRDLYAQFIVAAGACHTRLRQIAQEPGGQPDLDAVTRDALTEAGIHEIRERLFIDATENVAAAGQTLYERLRDLRRAVAEGASWSSREFHDVYHPYLDAAWGYRAAVRKELGSAPFVPSAFGWVTLNGAATCPVCQSIET